MSSYYRDPHHQFAGVLQDSDYIQTPQGEYDDTCCIDEYRIYKQLKQLFQQIDRVYKLSHLPVYEENVNIINNIVFGGLNVVTASEKLDNSYISIRQVVQYSNDSNIPLASILAKLPKIIQDNYMDTYLYDSIEEAEYRFHSSIYHEKQRDLLCIIHALNNVLQARVFTSVNSIDYIVDGCINLFSVAQEYCCGVNGDYFDDTISLAVTPLGISAIMLPQKIDCSEAWKIVENNPSFVGAILQRRNHYVALVKLSRAERINGVGEVCIIDSQDSCIRRWKNSNHIPAHLNKFGSIHLLICTDVVTDTVYTGKILHQCQKYTSYGKKLSADIGKLW